MVVQIDLNKTRFHIEKEQHRHWCPRSEPVTSGEALASMLDQGWAFAECACYHHQRDIKGRSFHLYSFCLQRGYHVVRMTVISNPYILRVIKQHDLAVIETEIQAVATV